MRHILLAAALLVCLLTAPAAAAAPAPVYTATAGDLEAKFDADRRWFRLCRCGDPVLEGLIVTAKVGEGEVSSADKRLKLGECSAAAGTLTIRFENAFTVKVVLKENEAQVHVEGNRDGPATVFAGVCRAGLVAAMLQDEAAADRGVLVTTLGPAIVPGVSSLYKPQTDTAMTIGPAQGVRWEHYGGQWLVRAPVSPAQPATFRFIPHYYRDTLGIKYFAPMQERRRWPTAPVVAMTWYGIEAMKGRPAQTMERLRPEIDWVAAHLLPYTDGNLVFQLDDNYPERDDKAMREISDYIRARGLVPGIWFTPFGVAPEGEAEKHPDWFLRGADGKLLTAFGGISYKLPALKGQSNYVLNVTNPDAVEAWYGMWWKKVSQTWNFDFFKIDGQPGVVGAYAKSANGGGVDGYRKGLQIARSIVGPEKFINACWGTPVEALGRVDGSRTGGDTGYHPHAVEVVLRWNFLNNVAWRCDPDAAASLYKAPIERVRLNAQARALTGQQFLTDDLWTKVSPETMRAWQRSFPALDIRPVNLYAIKDWHKYDHFDLRVAKPWGTYDVVGLFNFDGAAAEKALDLGRLPLETREVHVYDFWRAAYVGRFACDAKIPQTLAAYEGRVFSLVPVAADDRPVLISTSRHISQGGLDLAALAWKQDGPRWVAAGKSTHLVKGDAYDLVFAAGRYGATAAKASAGKVSTARSGGTVRATILPEAAGEADWEVAFEPVAGAAVDVSPSALELAPGKAGEIALESAGAKPVRFKARASDPRVRLSADKGELGPSPAKTKIAVSADTSGMKPGETLAAQVTVEAEDGRMLPQTVEVRVLAPPPENLALKAKATASSTWTPGNYAAAKAADGDPATRWNSREGDKDGAWVELAWQQPVAFDRVVIDECTDFGERIQAWSLMAGDGQMREIARGQRMGRRHAVDLAQPAEARRLRLVIEKASVTPSIWEIEVQRARPQP